MSRTRYPNQFIAIAAGALLAGSLLAGAAASGFAPLASQEKSGAAKAAAAPIEYDGGVVAWYAVKDFAKSVAWYQEMLGLKVHLREDEMGWAELETAAERMLIGLSRADAVGKGGGATVVLGVKDLDAVRARLEKQGVKFDGETVVYEGFVKLAIFLDPDGNPLQLSQSLVPEKAPAR